MCLGCVGDHCTSPLHRLPPPKPRRQKKQGGPSSQDMPAQLRLPPRRPSQMRGATPERDVSPLCNIVPTDPIMYPSSLIAEFKRISEDNTRNRIETGGVLFGRMDEHDTHAVVTKLIIPKQTATATSWEVRSLTTALFAPLPLTKYFWD